MYRYIKLENKNNQIFIYEKIEDYDLPITVIDKTKDFKFEVKNDTYYKPLEVKSNNDNLEVEHNDDYKVEMITDLNSRKSYYLIRILYNSQIYINGQELKLPKFTSYRGMKGALSLIRDLSIDYDGFRSKDGLMGLIDELKEIAQLGVEEGGRFNVVN